MFENFLFSLNVSLPIFLMMILGFFLRKWKILGEGFLESSNTLLFNVVLPIKIFTDMIDADFTQAFDGGYALMLLLGTSFFFFLYWLYGIFFIKNPHKTGAFVHGTFRGNYVYIGFPLIMNILQQSSLPGEAMLAGALVIPLYNILAVIVLTVTNHPGEKIDVKKIILGIIKNPMILAILIGLPFSFLRVLCGFELPKAIDSTLSSLGGMATPLALIIIGANLRFSSLKENSKLVAVSAFCRLIMQPLIVVPLGILFGFTKEAIVTLFVIFGVPAAANTYIVTKKMGGDAELASGIVIVDVILSLFTMTLGIFILRSLGIF